MHRLHRLLAHQVGLLHGRTDQHPFGNEVKELRLRVKGDKEYLVGFPALVDGPEGPFIGIGRLQPQRTQIGVDADHLLGKAVGFRFVPADKLAHASPLDLRFFHRLSETGSTRFAVEALLGDCHDPDPAVVPSLFMQPLCQYLSDLVGTLFVVRSDV